VQTDFAVGLRLIFSKMKLNPVWAVLISKVL